MNGLRKFSLSLVTILACSNGVPGDVGVFNGNGQSLQLVTSEQVALDEIRVIITPGRHPVFGGVGIVDYDCEFKLRNLKAEPCSVQVGFPIDGLGFGPTDEELNAPRDYASDIRFIAKDQRQTYHPRFEWRRTPGQTTSQPSEPQPSGAIFLWTLHFEPHEEKSLKVLYVLPISFTLASTSKDENASSEGPATAEWLNILEGSLLLCGGYVTETGSSWAGKVKSASFELKTSSFERYLNHRRMIEDEEENARAGGLHAAMMAHEPWWHLTLSPDGYVATQDGVRWTYRDFEPKDPIRFGYYLTFLPRTPAAVDTMLQYIKLRAIEVDFEIENIQLLRQVILASCGQQPTDETARKFVESQNWYHPRKDFSIDQLTPRQKAILARLDERLATWPPHSSSSKK